MRPGSRVMFTIAAFLAVMSVVYIFATQRVADDGYMHRTEWAGVVALVLSFLLALMLGLFMQFTDNRSDVLPEDWEEAEVEDSAGTLGFFSPSSIWPFTMACSVGVLGFGIIFSFLWLLALGALMLVWSTAMLSLQYGIPREKH